MPRRPAVEPPPGGDHERRGRRPSGDGPSPVPASGPPGRSTTRRPSWILAAATFVVGLGLGVALPDGGDRDGDRADAPTTGSAPTPTSTAPTPPDGDVVTVPRSCLDVADRAEQLAALVRDAAVAAGELDASELSGIVRQMDEAQAGLEEQTRRCRTGADPIP